MSSLRNDLWMAACFFLAVSSLPNLYAAEKKPAKGKAEKKPAKGTAEKRPAAEENPAKDIIWQQIGIDAARKLEKPILLYIYDPQDVKPSTAAKQHRVFYNQSVKQAFAPFTMVRQPVRGSTWPLQYTAHAKNGVALLVMTCDAEPLAVFIDLPEAVTGSNGNEEYPMLLGAAKKALNANPKVLEAVRNALRKASESGGDAVASLLDGAAKNSDGGKKANSVANKNGAGEPDNEVE